MQFEYVVNVYSTELPNYTVRIMYFPNGKAEREVEKQGNSDT